MANQIIGTILSIGPTQDLVSKSGNSFKRRDVVVMIQRFDTYTGQPVSDNENTPQLSFMGERCAELDKFQPGQTVVIFFDIQGKKYTDSSNTEKIINDIRPYRIELYQPRVFGQPQAMAPAVATPPVARQPYPSVTPPPQSTPSSYPAQHGMPRYPQNGDGYQQAF